MTSGWRYRVLAVFGSAALTVSSVLIASNQVVEAVTSLVPVLGRLPAGPTVPGGLPFEVATATVVVLATLAPLYKPRPRRILDTILLAQKRVFLAMIGLAAIGYFDYTYRLPRLTLILTAVMLFAFVPAWFLAIRRQPPGTDGRAIVVGDDPETIADILAATEQSVIGYVSPPSAYYEDEVPGIAAAGYTDGGPIEELDDLPCLGGLSRLDEVLVDHDVDTALLAFAHPDREEFFGALDTCYEHGVAAKVHREHADAVLTSRLEGRELIDVNLEPWDWQDYVFKRVFDVVFAATALLILSPLLVMIAVTIKLDNPGPVLYRQTRTAAFGDTFTVAKFRTMLPDSEDVNPVDDEENDRITRLGKVLRRTHLDEIPQLWSVLKGEMSVVGPRAVWVDEEALLQNQTTAWRRRWFVKPGLTGLAQINGASSTAPETKLRYDIEYIRQQSFWFDVKIVVRQVWIVLGDVVETVRS